MSITYLEADPRGTRRSCSAMMNRVFIYGQELAERLAAPLRQRKVREGISRRVLNTPISEDQWLGPRSEPPSMGCGLLSNAIR